MFWGKLIEGGDKWYYTPLMPMKPTPHGRALNKEFLDRLAQVVEDVSARNTGSYYKPGWPSITLGWAITGVSVAGLFYAAYQVSMSLWELMKDGRGIARDLKNSVNSWRNTRRKKPFLSKTG